MPSCKSPNVQVNPDHLSLHRPNVNTWLYTTQQRSTTFKPLLESQRAEQLNERFHGGQKGKKCDRKSGKAKL